MRYRAVNDMNLDLLYHCSELVRFYDTSNWLGDLDNLNENLPPEGCKTTVWSAGLRQMKAMSLQESRGKHYSPGVMIYMVLSVISILCQAKYPKSPADLYRILLHLSSSIYVLRER